MTGKTFTIISVCEWEMLFDSERLVEQNHSIDLQDIIARANGAPVILRYVNAEGSQLDEELYESGDLALDTTLDVALAKCGKGRRVGFAA